MPRSASRLATPSWVLTIALDDLSAATGYSITSSGFANGLSGLRVLDLVHGPNGGDLSIADVCADERVAT